MTTPLKWEPNGRLVRCLKFEPLFNPSLIPLFLIFFFCLLHKKTKKEKEETVMAKRKASSYEEIRLKRLEENKKRLEALNLPKLAQALRNSSPSKPSSVKPITTAFFLPHKNEKLKKKSPYLSITTLKITHFHSSSSSFPTFPTDQKLEETSYSWKTGGHCQEVRSCRQQARPHLQGSESQIFSHSFDSPFS